MTTPSGKALWNGTNTGNSSKVAPNLLHWPSPLESASYAFMDSPRFTVPPWGPTPMPNVSTGLAPGRTKPMADFMNDKAKNLCLHHRRHCRGLVGKPGRIPQAHWPFAFAPRLHLGCVVHLVSPVFRESGKGRDWKLDQDQSTTRFMGSRHDLEKCWLR